MAASLLAPLSTQDMQASLAQAGDAVIRSSTLLADMAAYHLNMLTQDNLDGGMLLVLGGPEPRPMTTEEFDQYRLYFGQMDAIARMWTEGSPPAVGLVQPWLNLFRSTGNVRLP
jgi:hypothetical protein